MRTVDRVVAAQELDRAGEASRARARRPARGRGPRRRRPRRGSGRRSARYAGVQPITAVATSISSSGTSTRWRSSPNRFSSRAPVSPSVGSSGAWQITPRWISVVIVGIVRTTGTLGKQLAQARDRSRARAPRRSRRRARRAAPRRVSSDAGLTASRIASERSASSASESTASPPASAASSAARPEPASQKYIASGPCSASAHPRASAVAMLPAPANPIFMPPNLRDARRSRRRSPPGGSESRGRRRSPAPAGGGGAPPRQDPRATALGPAASDEPYDWLKKPFSTSRAFSSAETSTLRGVSRKVFSAIFCMPPSSA